MRNPISKTNHGPLIALDLAIDGADLCKATITLLRFPFAVLVAIRLAAMSAWNDYEAAKSTLLQLRVTLTEARQEARAFAMLTRDILRPFFGAGYSEAWNVTGFAGSLETPVNVNELAFLLQRLVSFLTANPSLEIPSRHITAAHAQTLFITLTNARAAVNDQETTVSNLLAARDEKITGVRKCLRGLINELTEELSPLDARWKAFGLNPPGADQTPDAPENVEVTVVHETKAMITFPRTARADYYRVYKRVLGVDAEPVAIGSPADPNFTFEDLLKNTSVEFYVSAVNNGGESAMSRPVTIVAP